MQDYARILEDLQNQRAAIDEAIDAISRLLSTTTGVEVGGHRAPTGAFANMTVIEAARKYLTMIQRPAPTKEIVQALEKGGLQHNAKDFYASVYAILRQQAQKGDKAGIRRNALDWELTETT